MIHSILKNTKIVLASASPRRVDILKLVGLDFIQKPADINEDIVASDHINPTRYVRKIATEKCNTIQNLFPDDHLVIAADTIVYFDNKILGKPQNDEEAFYYLSALSGNTHIVYTALSVSFKGHTHNRVEKTSVKFKRLSDNEIHQYILTSEPFDKAGAYGIQGYGSQFIEKINGCFFNVMGFPVNLFYKLVAEISDFLS